jgi:flagellar biosynthesis/type III secretory pathway protein FliH
MVAAGMELIKNSKLEGSPNTPGYEKVLSQHREDNEAKGSGDHFVRFRPDGSLSVVKKPVEVPQVDNQEIQQRRLEKIEREIYQKAFAEGEKTGLEVGQEKMEQEIHRLIPQLESVLRELDNLPSRVFAASEHFLVESLLSFSRELLAHELTINPEGIAERVNRIMEKSIGRKDIVIRVSPGNAEILRHMEAFEKIEIKADNAVNPGSVVMESDFGGIEDNLDERLRDMEMALRQQLQERLDQSGVTDIADAAHQKAQQVEDSEITPLATDPEFEEPEEPFLASEEDEEFPLESIEDELLDVEDHAEVAEENGGFPLEAVSDAALDSFLLDDSVSMEDTNMAAEPAPAEEVAKDTDSGEWSALADEEQEPDDAEIGLEDMLKSTDEEQE